ncbi:MAG: hypothetical protein AVDCRST_MAG71-3002 [uncultured Lysobacter sp.]|uniref:Antitoxin Xre/MbcA/ParS-like toxin-binding domain-containing protein n=1 Tax=uncultured Lysobacter sp. TaxID=271060 RepID=A0A6J4M9N4_9GAMM|nr:MAG: hypothetical protein AVDCRST_MAG71-3002 [uncultured Lysobacter sp.]
MHLQPQKLDYHDVRSGDARVSAEALTLDTLRAARNLELQRPQLEALLGADPDEVDRLLDNRQTLSPRSEQGMRALLLVRLNRALGDVFGSLHRAREWLDTLDPALGGRPGDLLRTREGLERVLGHMELSSKDFAW